MGLPLVLSDIPGCRQVARDRVEGLFVPPRAPAALADAILRLLRDPSELASVSSRCRAFMAREYAEDRILTPYLTAFEELTRASVPHTLATSARRHV